MDNFIDKCVAILFAIIFTLMGLLFVGWIMITVEMVNKGCHLEGTGKFYYLKAIKHEHQEWVCPKQP